MAFVEYKGEILPYSFEDKAIDKVLELEGGYNPKDPVTGMPVKYGIDQRANPDIDVSKLTKEDARKIYRDRYWSASGAAELPERLALVHFDAAVNQGPEKAKQLLEASGGDPDKYVELRKAEYQRLAEQDPRKYGSSLKGWMNRLDSLQASVAPAFEEYTGEIIPLEQKGILSKAKDYIGEQADLLKADAKIGIINTKMAVTQNQIAGLMELQEADFAKYGKDLEGMPEADKAKHMATRKKLEEYLGEVAKYSTEVKNVEKEYGVRGSTKALMQTLPESEEYKNASTFDKFKMVGERFIEDPAGIIVDLGIQSLPQSLAIASTALAARMGRLDPKVSAGAGGVTSAMSQFGGEYAKLREQGMDHIEAWEKAGVKSGVVGLFDAASFMSAGNAAEKIISNISSQSTKKAIKETAKEVSKETAKQAGLGATGEAVGATVIGQELEPTEIAAEAIGEIFGAPGEAVGTYRGKRAEAAAAKAEPQAKVEPTFREVKDEEIIPITEEEKAQIEFAGAPEIEVKGVGQVPPSQDTDVMMAELEGTVPQAPIEEAKAEEPEIKAKEAKVEEAPVEETAPLEKAVSVKDMSPEDQKTIRAMEVEKNKISREKKLFPEFLRRQGVQPSEKADLGLEGISRPGIFKKSAPTFDELTSRAINEGFLVSTGDDVQDVENFREHVRDYIGSGQITTGPDTAREAQLNSLDEAIQEIVRKYEKPSFGLEQPTPADLRAREEATKLREEEAARIEEEDKARRDREEIARLSQESEFALGRTAAEDLMGQKNIFEQPADIEAEMAKKVEEDKAEAERIRQQGGEDADIPFLNIERKQTSTPEFKKWFGDSKVVNEDGSPMVVYHGTNKDFDKFSKTADIGFHFGTVEQANNRNIIDRFWSSARPKEGSNVMPVYIKLENPLRVKDLKENWDLGLLREMVRLGVLSEEKMDSLRKEGNEKQNWKQLAVRTLKDLGYDGLVYENIAEGRGDSYVVLEPNQIKSAIGNRGTFSTEEDNIIFDVNRLPADQIFPQEQLAKKPSLRVELNRLVKANREGKIPPENFAIRTEQILGATKKEREYKPRERGQDIIIEKLRKAVRRGEISREAMDLAEWFIKKNPSLVDDAAISVRAPKENEFASGIYNPMSRLIFLIKGSGSSETVVHEILHHIERMLPKDIQDGIRKAWAQSLAKADKAAQSGKDADLKRFFQYLMDYHYNGDKKAMKEANDMLNNGTVGYEQYQYINPSEFWAVNAADIVSKRYDAANSIVGKLKRWLAELAETIKNIFGFDNKAPLIKALNSLSKSDGKFVSKDMLGHALNYANIHRNYLGGQPPLATWDTTGKSKLAEVKSDLLYKLQDKFIDLKDAQKAITDAVGDIEERWNAYMQEELYHGRTAKRTEDFLRDELLPIIKELKAKNLTLDQFEEYLHNRHAEERNAQIARINEDMPDGGSGIMTKDAREYLAKLDPKQKAAMDSVAQKIDKMVYETQEILLKEGLEDAKTINTWRKTYKNYVPLERDLDVAGQTFTPGSQGYGTRGKTSKRATGSEKDVINILANLAIQREKAIMKAEKAKIGRALYGLAIKNPNPGVWLPVNPDAIKDPKALAKELQSLGLSAEDALNFIKEPVTKMVKDGVVVYAPNINDRFADSVFPIRINGKDRFIFFNTKNPSAVRLVKSLKNIDVQQLAGIIGMTAKITRFVAAMNTQYNPVFGAWNFTRDVAGAMFNLSTTPIADQKAKVLAGTFPALRAIYKDLRSERKEETKSDKEWSKLFERFQNAGGQTGYKNQFAESEKKANIIEREMAYLDRGNVKKTVDAIAGWLSDYNDAMENAVRLSAFKAAIDKGYSDARAASIAKNLTVNFNRKGAWSTGIGALYAFFNASVQGTARLAETMTGPAGKKIFAGGLLLGAFQALALSMAGFDEDEPPEFLKDKNLIIPYGDGKYVIVPMPLGFNAIPSTGRRITELVLTNGEDASGKIIDMMGMWADAFNPIGTGSLAQMMSPTFADPIVSARMNKDTFGRPIYKEDRATAPVPGYMMSRDGASTFSKYLSEFINYVTSPSDTKYTKGKFSPTADEIDYIIGQYTGGVGREAMKAGETAKGLITGEPVEPHRKPISGKILGDIESKQAVTSKFYKNVTDLAKLEGEVKGRAENQEDPFGYIQRHPKAKLMDMANDVENEVSQINQDIKEIRKRRPDDKDAVKRMEDAKLRIMRNFNQRVKESDK